MKQKIGKFIAVLMMLLMMAVSFSACIDRSKWRLKEQGGPPNWQDERIDYGA